MNKEKVVLFWSGGKDSAFALFKMQLENKYEVVALISTLNQKYKRLSMHGIREDLIEAQSQSIGIPLFKMYVNEGTHKEYNQVLNSTLQSFSKQGIHKVAYGDIFLEDLREYRDKMLTKQNMEGLYPLWKSKTSTIILDFLNAGFKTKICCVYSKYLKKEICGKDLNIEMIEQFPTIVDPCGENGEFHTYCFDGPIFKRGPIQIDLGKIIYKPVKMPQEDSSFHEFGFWYSDIYLTNEGR